MKYLRKIFSRDNLIAYPESEQQRIIVFRKFVAIMILNFSIVLAVELIVDFKIFDWWSFALVILLFACFLVLSVTDSLAHKYLVRLNLLAMLLVSQVGLLINPESFHVMIFWLGITPLFVVVLSGVRNTIIWSVAVGIVIIANGIYIQSEVGAYTLELYPFRFLLAGIIFLVTTAFMASFYGKTQHDVRTRLFLQNQELASLTEQVELQNRQLKEYNDHLEGRVNERTLEIEKQKGQLTEYAFINSHLLRSPLARILGMLDLLSRTETTDEQRQYIQRLLASSRELDSVIKRINKALEKAEELNRHSLRKPEEV